MNELFNESEQLVYDICKGSFLSFWNYPNPLGKDGKELCDTLVVCEPDIIIFSVKDIGLTDSGDLTVDWTRWRKRAIDASAKQIYGAERWLNGASLVIRGDGSPGIKLPRREVRRIHRVAVALGDQGKAPIRFGDFGKGFVHVFDKTSLNAIMGELDTIEDFVAYLSAKETLYFPGKTTLFQGGEEDLLALYLHNGRQFPERVDMFVIDDNLWDGFKDNEYYKARKEADSESYVWDRLVATLSNDILHDNLEFGPELNDSEIAVRTMTRENRFGRRILGKSFMEFYDLSHQKKVRSRMALGYSGVIYVFLAMPHGEDREYRTAELSSRCLVAKGLHKELSTVVGLATERYEEGKGFSFDLVHMHIPQWTDEMQKQMDYLQKEFGYFVKPRLTKVHEDEYPQVMKGT